MKAVLISIQPKWCKLIASGKKTVEVRKNKPKLETPFKCYIYCTQGKTANGKNLYINPPDKRSEYGVVEDWEIKNDKIDIGNGYGEYTAFGASGKVIGEFVCDKVNTIRRFGVGFDVGGVPISKSNFEAYKLIKESCLTERELRDYIIDDYGYCWHISDLKIYDKPKELSEFYKPCPFNDECTEDCHYCVTEYHGDEVCGNYEPIDCLNRVTRPQQSWCYVEEIRK